ncbi:MAG: alpha/beta hydrolase [Clostridia bacterium]|nr:alpha/beta hydrolase [Clostridia bacterium]
MNVEKICIQGIPALIWGPESSKVYLWVHGKMGSKEAAEGFARLAVERGYQVISFDLPMHGERKHENKRCDIWQGVHDLAAIGDYVFAAWKNVSLYACSLGAYFSLHAYSGCPFSKCLFQSPIVDMNYLIRQMFLWFGVSEERLAREKEIDTPIDLLRWDYYQYVLSHPVVRWEIPTSILYGGKDDLQSLAVMQDFSQRFGAEITLSENSSHSFMEETDYPVVDRWLSGHI